MHHNLRKFGCRSHWSEWKMPTNKNKQNVREHPPRKNTILRCESDRKDFESFLEGHGSDRRAPAKCLDGLHSSRSGDFWNTDSDCVQSF